MPVRREIRHEPVTKLMHFKCINIVDYALALFVQVLQHIMLKNRAFGVLDSVYKVH